MQKSRSTNVIIFLLLAFFSVTTLACAQRMPKPKTAQAAIKSYFRGYGNDYKDSDFGQYDIDDIEISEIIELQHGMVLVIAYVSLGDGDVVYKVAATLLKKTIRWRLLSWENLGRAS